MPIATTSSPAKRALPESLHRAASSSARARGARPGSRRPPRGAGAPRLAAELDQREREVELVRRDRRARARAPARMPRAPRPARGPRARPCRGCADRSRRAATRRRPCAPRQRIGGLAVGELEQREVRHRPSARRLRPARAHQLRARAPVAVLEHDQRLAHDQPRRARV